MFGFSFLNTPFLIFLSSLILPIIIYLITKKKPQKIIFSSIKYIKESVQQRKKKINLKNILLLLIRLLILLFVILGLSRPILKTKKGNFSKNHPKTAIAIIIDNSYSMDYIIDTQTELEKAKEIAKKINGILTNDDAVVLLNRDDNWNKINAEINYGKLKDEKIEKISVTPLAVEVNSLIKTAETFLKQSQYANKEIYYITDFQKDNYPVKTNIPLYIIKTSNSKFKKNIAVVSTKPIQDFTEDKLKRKIYFEVQNFSDTKQTDLICSLIIDNRTVSEKVLSLQPFQKKSGYFTTSLNSEGWHTGYVKVKNERLEYDNKNYFAFYIKKNPKVALITSENEFPPSLVSILKIYTNDLSIINTNDLNFNLFNNYDNVIFYKPTPSQRLFEILKNNDKYIMIAGENDDESLKEFYQKIFGFKITGFYNDYQSIKIDKVNRFSRITKLFSKVKKPKLNYFFKVKNNKSETLLAAGDYPISIMNNKGAIIWLFSLDNDNPFTVSAMFPAFAYNCLVQTSSLFIENNAIKVGDKIKLKNNKLILPSGKMIFTNKNIYVAHRQGIYDLLDRKIAVNLDFSESNYVMNKPIKAKNITVTYKDWRSYIFKNGFGKDVWKYFFLIALILFILEMIIIKMEERR